MTVPSTVTCPQCHKELPVEAKVCGYCGHRLAAAVAESSPGPGSVNAGPIVGAALVMSSAVVPWFLPAIGPSQWGASIPRLFGLRVHSALSPQLGSFGTLLLVLGAVGLALSLRARPTAWRRVLGLTVIAVVASAVVWELSNGTTTFLHLLGIGPITALAGSLLLLTGRRART